MTNAFEELASLDKLVHEPARLSILTALSTCQSADFIFLQRLTGLTGGNLSAHLGKLGDAGLIQMEKQFIEKRPNTLIQITKKGKETVDRHWRQLAALRKDADEWKPIQS